MKHTIHYGVKNTILTFSLTALGGAAAREYLQIKQERLDMDYKWERMQATDLRAAAEDFPFGDPEPDSGYVKKLEEEKRAKIAMCARIFWTVSALVVGGVGAFFSLW